MRAWKLLKMYVNLSHAWFLIDCSGGGLADQNQDPPEDGDDEQGRGTQGDIAGHIYGHTRMETVENVCKSQSCMF
eukprot:COSAG05_NODE_2735_length_2712_cov_2.337543_5_plen_75_part_00